MSSAYWMPPHLAEARARGEHTPDDGLPSCLLNFDLPLEQVREQIRKAFEQPPSVLVQTAAPRTATECRSFFALDGFAATRLATVEIGRMSGHPVLGPERDT